MRRRRPAALAILLSLIAGACSQAPASDAWPRQSVRLVVPFGAGTGTDLAARLLAPRLADRWGTSVIVDNRPGSDGVIGTQAFVSAKDDHVLLFTPAGPLTVSPFLHERLPYDPARDLVPISSIGSPSIVIAVAASVAATSISELVDVVRRHEREYRWAAVAGVPELVFKAFVQLERLEVTHVAYRDMSTALQDLGRGRIHVMVASLPTVWPQINAGAARPLAVTNSVRAPSAPHVATAAEAGYPALTVDGLWGFFGWDGISDALRRKLAADIAQAAADRPLVERLSAIGLVVRTGSPDEFAAAVDRQRIQVTSVAAILGLTRAPPQEALMYAFANAAPQARARLTALAEVFDPGTIRHLSGRGIAPGWACLEIGGGIGSITRWLATRVGPTGTVVTTDIDTRHLTALRLPNVDVRCHDVVEDDLPEQAFDLVFTRLVLQHVSDPHRALTNMLRSVKPGGWMLVEDFEVLPGLAHSAAEGMEQISKTAAAMRQVTAAAGADARFGRSLPRRFRAAGLTDVGVEGRVFLWNGGSTGALFTRLNYEQLREAVLATGRVTGDEYDADVARLDDEKFEVRSPVMWTAWGRRPPP